jgi:hypothetical protein
LCTSQLQRRIEKEGRLLEFKDKSDAFFITFLRLLRHPLKSVISHDCAGASMCEVQKVEPAWRHAAEVHPNHPSIELIRKNNDEIASSSDHPNTEVRPSCVD